MRIGFLTSDLHHQHGWGHYSLSLIRALRAQGVDAVVAASNNSPTDFEFDVHPVLPALAPAEPRQLAKLAMGVPDVRKLFAGCDLIHATAEPYAPLAMWAAGKRPFVLTGHGSYVQAGIQRHFGARKIHQRAFRRATTVICVSHYTAQRAQAYLPHVHTTVINNGIDPDAFRNLPTLPQTVTRPTVLTAGGVKQRKGTPQLVRAMSTVRDNIPDAQCIIIGRTDTEPETLREVETAINALRLDDVVRLTGFVENDTLLAWYNAADVFVLPSINDGWKFEGFGLVHLEASAAGLPVIGTRDCGAEDAIAHDVTGLLISQERIADELPTALIHLLEDPEKRALMGTAGRKRSQEFTWEHTAQQVLATYERVLSR
ncbi:MAG: glycosyltransferase family 4 protein [Chloroflexota bacterium]